MFVYTGIGSRQTPEDVCLMMEVYAETLGAEGWTLRSGGAPGADVAFERGCDRADGKKEIYLPWNDFNLDDRQDLDRLSDYATISPEALAMAEAFHPSFTYLKFGARKLMARNSYQIFGFDMDVADATDLVICWTKGGKGGGGTGQAIRIANHYGIPVVDLGVADHFVDHMNMIGEKVAEITRSSD